MKLRSQLQSLLRLWDDQNGTQWRTQVGGGAGWAEASAPIFRGSQLVNKNVSV